MTVLSLWVLLYGLCFSLSERLSYLMGTAHTVTVFSMPFYLCLLLFFIAKRKKAESCGLCMPHGLKGALPTFALLFAAPLVNICFYRYAAPDAAYGLWYFTGYMLTLYSAFSEELLFRGTLPLVLHSRLGVPKKAGAALSNVIFALLHTAILSNTDGLPLFARFFIAFGIGMCFSSVRDRTGSIFPCFIIHFLINITFADSLYSVYSYRLIWLILAAVYTVFGVYYYLFLKEDAK